MMRLGHARAQAFHEGLHAGIQAGIELMRKYTLAYMDERAKRNAFGNIENMQAEIKRMAVPQPEVTH